MARPKKKGLDYFPHDVDLSSDEKIVLLEAHHGLEGYAVYLKMIERLFRAGGYLTIDDNMLLVLAKKFSLEKTQLTKILETCIVEAKLLKRRENNSGGYTITSGGVLKRIRTVEANRAEWREKKKGLSKGKTEGKTEKTPQSKVKESKGKKSKENPPIIPPWVPKEAWEGYVEIRGKSKYPIKTEHQVTLLLNRLKKFKDQGHDIEEIIHRATESEWRTFYPPSGGGKVNGKTEHGGVKAPAGKYDGVARTFGEKPDDGSPG